MLRRSDDVALRDDAPHHGTGFDLARTVPSWHQINSIYFCRDGMIAIAICC